MVQARGLALQDRLSATDLDLHAGQMVCLVGPNGSGKTSLMHAAAGIGSPAGKITIDGVDPWREPPSRRSAFLTYLAASRDIAWPLIARDLVGLGLPQDIAQSRIEDMLARFELSHLAERRIDHLSTGERSRLLIARALLPRPKFLLLDEPIANLDPLWQLRLMEELKATAEAEGCAVLAAVHDLDLAGRYAERMLIMDRGAIRADGSPADLLPSEHVEQIFRIRASERGWDPLR